MVEGIGEVTPVLLWKDDEHHLRPATVDFYDVNGALHLRAFEVGEPAIIAVDVECTPFRLLTLGT